MYKSRGSPWLGAAYDPSRLSTATLGTMTLDLVNADVSSVGFFTVYPMVATQPLYRFRF